jgi:hypothetical protein
MPQRITKTDEAYVHKQLKRPHDASGNVFEIRRIVLNNLGHKVYLMYGVENPPDFDDVDDEWDETSGAEKDYITAGLYLKADDAKKAVAAYEKEKEKEARTQPQRERLARTEAPARQPPAAPVRAGARPARAAAAGAARVLRRIHDGGCDTDEDELIDDEPSPPVDEGAEGAEGAERANDMEEDVVPPSALVMRDRTPELGLAPQPEPEEKDEDGDQGGQDDGGGGSETAEHAAARAAAEREAAEDRARAQTPAAGATDYDSEEYDEELTEEEVIGDLKWGNRDRTNIVDRDSDMFKPLSKLDKETGMPTGEPRVEGPTTKLPPDAAEVKYLFEFLTPNMLELVVAQTNLYQQQQETLAAEQNLKADVGDEVRYRTFKKLERKGLCAIIGVLIYMGVGSLGAYKEYWTPRANAEQYGVAWTGSAFVQEDSGVSLNTFENFLRFVHFEDVNAAPDPSSPGYDRAWKMRRYLSMFAENCRAGWTVAKELSIDEMMIRFKGRCAWKQYMPDKPIKWGLKVWGLCNAKNGYLLNFELYCGKSDEAVGLATSIVLKLIVEMMAVQTINGLHIYMDNYYSSPTLFYKLALYGVLACGTMRCNRKGWPTQVSFSASVTDARKVT